MYRILYNDNVIFDPYGENEVVTDAKLSSEINAASYLDFTMSPEHPLYNTVAERDGIVHLYYDSEELFEGVIDSIETDFNGYKSISCVSALDYLNDTVVRPYSTVSGEEDLTAPSEIDAYFSWLIQQHNSHVLDSYKQFEIGINEASKFNATNSIYVKNTSSSPTATEITNNLLDPFGGYLTLRYEDGNLVLDLHSDVHDMNAQVIDFGINLLDFTRTVDTKDQYTAIRPVGGTPEGESDSKPVTIESIIDGPTSYNGDVTKQGDVIYSVSAVKRYGYKETEWRTDDASKPEDLLSLAVPQLIKMAYPIVGIDIKAIDLSLYMEGYKHLSVGQAVRIRSIPHGIDEYMMVSSINLDLQDPGQSEYVLGTSYDTLTGQQSTYLRTLNNGINSSLDKVEALDRVDKEQAIAIGNAQQAADDAQHAADNAQQSANNAQNTANANKEAIDSIKDAQTEYEKQLEQMQQGVADATEEIGQVNERIEGMNSEIESAKSDIDSLRSSTETELQNVKQSVSKVQSDVDAVTQKASDIASDLDGTKATVEQVTTDLGEVKTTVSNAATKADQALQVSTSASQTATEAKTTATSAYRDAQSALTQSSTASQTANAVKTELETKYSTTDEIAEQYATKSLVEQTSQSITSTVEAIYATKATVEALENIANNAVQTWMGSGVPTLSNKPASDWTTAELKSQHSGDIYYDSDTGYSYRFGSSDGKNYSWSLIKDTDISKAVADAAKAQQTAEGVSDEVTQLKTDIPATYATKTEVKQTTDSIKSTVSEVASTANSALSKATTVEQTANGLQTTVTEQAEKLEGAVTTISQVSQKVDSVSSTITQVSGDIDRIDSNSQNFITNPQFKSGNADGVAKTAMNASDSGAGKLPGTATTYGKSTGGWSHRAENVKIKGIPGHTYRIEIDAKRASDNTDASASEGLALFFWYMASDNPDLSGTPSYTPYNANLIPASVTDWTHATYDYTFPNDKVHKVIRPAYRTTPSKNWLVTNFTCTDVTAIAEAQKDADTATSTANSALSQSSTVKQELTSFKTSVQQTYETKNDALSKQSSLQQSVNNLRTEVSETYTTKTEFDNLRVGGTNLFVMRTSKDGFRVSADGGEFHDSGYTISDHISVQPNQKYILTAYMDGSEDVSNDYVSIARYRSNKTWIDRPIMDTNSFRYGDSWVITTTSETAYVRLSFPTSGKDKFKFERGTKPTDWSPSPEDMLSTAEAAKTYSTKSYVDQTARTVSLGVVEEYKDGQHGSALATQSDITAAKDSITSTVSQTYATKNDVGVGNLIKNGDFSDGSSNWMTNGGTSKVVDGTYGKQLVFTQTGTNTNGSNRIYNPSYSHINGQSYEVSFYAKADKSSKWHFGPNNSSKAAAVTLDTTLKQYTMQYQADGTTVLSVWTDNPTATIYLERVKLSIASGYYATKTEVKQTSDSLTVTISSAMSKAESAATAASNAQNTANTANTNATNANNRVGNLETCIKMTSDGVRVGKILNGNFTGYSALVNSAGSFDILNASSNKVVTFGPTATKFYDSSGIAKLGMLYDANNNLYQVGTLASNSATKIDSGLTVDGSMLNLTSSDRNVKIQAANGRIELHPSPDASEEDNGVCFYSGIRFEHDGVAVRHFRRGSTVLNPNGASGASVTTAIRHLNGDVFIAINGDWKANRLVIMGTDYDDPYYNVRFYNPGNGNLHSSIRIDWLLIETENV